MSHTVFQISEEMVQSSSTLTKDDIGLWCYLSKGRYHGFCRTKGECYLRVKSLLT
jgi:hypothetical protein